MSYFDSSRFEDIFLHLEVESVTRELSILEEAMHECSRPLAKKAFEGARMELLRDPAAYLLKQADTARLTWQHQPGLAKFIYQENDNI